MVLILFSDLKLVVLYQENYPENWLWYLSSVDLQGCNSASDGITTLALEGFLSGFCHCGFDFMGQGIYCTEEKHKAYCTEEKHKT